ncbi:hypothetical protein [uncultured Sulfitobacter sp.]|uniref:hypothetical protein n=1 Tax=uncultured Sulfitobacter sp. TaxID=191468 RepID=UPI00262E28CD|nr:hypothetical protein [uncultured Sulfitobacter sp.]
MLKAPLSTCLPKAVTVAQADVVAEAKMAETADKADRVAREGTPPLHTLLKEVEMAGVAGKGVPEETVVLVEVEAKADKVASHIFTLSMKVEDLQKLARSTSQADVADSPVLVVLQD